MASPRHNIKERNISMYAVANVLCLGSASWMRVLEMFHPDTYVTLLVPRLQEQARLRTGSTK